MPRGRAYRFVATPTGQDQTTREFQRAVRSHAASVSRPGYATRRRARARGRNDGEGVIVLDINPANPTEELDSETSTAGARTGELVVVSRRNQSANDRQPLAPNINTPQDPYRLWPDPLSGNTFSPVQHLPTYHKPYLPGIVNHYIVNLTIPIPELDGSSTVPLFRGIWLRVVFHDPVVFQVVVLFAATHYATLGDSSQFDEFYLELLSLKNSALLALIQRVQNEQTTSAVSTNQARDSRDTLIAAAAKMASYEAIFGTPEAFHLHMSTVTRLLRLQGGLAALGMDGFLARLLSFIDTNSAYLLGTNLHLGEFGLPNRTPHHQRIFPQRLDEVASRDRLQMRSTNVVDLEHFIGFTSIGDENEEGS